MALTSLDLSLPGAWTKLFPQAAPFFARHGNTFLNRLDSRAEYLEVEFKVIDTMGFKMPFIECMDVARRIIDSGLK